MFRCEYKSDIVRKEPHAVVWIGTAKDEKEFREAVMKLHAANPGVNFSYDPNTQATRTIKPEELDSVED
jgi:hypothetical protein